jgi:O-6-methylguanine DNA methyltransferase
MELNKIFVGSFKLSLGTFYLAGTKDHLIRLVLPGESFQRLKTWITKKINPIKIIETPEFLYGYAYEIQQYLNRQRKSFDSPLFLLGTSFQQKVWKEIQKIPYGQTRTYQDIAQRIRHPLACRAVGLAASENPLPIFIPCHRVISKKGLAGFSSGIKMKKWLLALEKNNL